MDSERPSFIMGIVIGMIAGAAIALLLAPMSGQETRSVITSKATGIKDKASNKIGGAVDQAGKSINRIQDKSTEMVNRQKDRVGKILRRTGEDVEAAEI